MIGFQPLLLQAGELRADQAAAVNHRPTISAAPNGVPLVNIVAPNGSGLSHNKYQQFNVGTPGLILNNSNQNVSRSQLGGLVTGNNNLGATGPARVILNEVTSSSRSSLNGVIEVHGRAADVIVANPNGVTCNGCGFINTPRVTLSTGIPELDSTGALARLRVEAGEVNIGLRGADLGRVNVFDIVSRRINIGGPVKVGDALNLVAGRNSYAYQTGLITPLASDGKEPGVAIDSSLLGGMYAGRIKLVSTDAGSGVNMRGQMAANAGQMTLTANGRLVLRKARARKAVKVTSTNGGIEAGNTLFSDEAITLDGKSAVVLKDSALVASTGNVRLKGAAVKLGSGALLGAGIDENGLQSASGTLTVEADTVEAGHGLMTAGAKLSVAADTINLARAADADTGNVRSLGDVVFNARSILAQNGRVTALGTLTARSGTSLELSGGTYRSAGDLLVEAADLTLRTDLGTQGTLRLASSGGYISNFGRVAGDAGLQINASAGVRNEAQLLSQGLVSVAAGAAVNNSADGKIVGDGGVEVNARSLANAGKIAAQGGSLNVSLSADLDNSGLLMSTQSATLSFGGALTNSANVAVEDGLTIMGAGANVVNTSAGTINGGALVIVVGSVNNSGLLTSHDGVLSMSLTGDAANSGAIEAKSDADILLDGNLSNSGSISSEGVLRIAGRSGGSTRRLTNMADGFVNGASGLIVSSSHIANGARIGSADGPLSVQASGDITNTGLFYSGTSSTFNLDGTFSNLNADVLAEADLTIVGLSADRAGAIRNRSGTLEAVSGNLVLKAVSIVNERESLDVGTETTSESSTSGATTTTVTTTRETVGQGSGAAKVLAGGSLVIEAGTLANSYSQIAANGDMTIAADNVTNTGRDLIKTVETTKVTQHSRRVCSLRILGICVSRKTIRWTTTESETASSTYDAVFGTIQAGGSLDADVTGYLTNNAVRSGASQIGLSSGARALDGVSVSPVSGVDPNVDLTRLIVSIDDLAHRGALFEVAQDPDAPFLIETRPYFVDPSKFLGSDYFLDQVGGYNPDQTARRLGDAYVETRLILDQVFGLTGRRYLRGFHDSTQMMRALYDNAIELQASLNLIVGVALTQGQISALNKDIIWLERRTVLGQSVLVPRLYLARLTLDNVNLASGQIKAGQAKIKVANLVNSGDITGRDLLDVSATDTVINQGGGLFSRSDIVVDAGKLFANVSGQVFGENVTITAENILNDTAKTEDQLPNGFVDRVQQIARIEAHNKLLLKASQSISAIGGRFASGGSTTLQAGQSVDLVALGLERLRDDKNKYGYDRASSLTHQLATVTAGGDVTVEAGGDVGLRGAKVRSGGNVTLKADGQVKISSVQDQASRELNLKVKSGGLLGTKTTIREQAASTTTRASSIDAKGDLTARAETGDVEIEAAKLKSTGETSLEAEQGKVKLQAKTDTKFEREEKREEDVFWWNQRDKGQTSETVNPVEIEAGGGLKILSRDGILVEYEKTGSFSASIDQMAKSPGLAWMAALKDDPRVDWKAIEAKFDSWDYKSQGLTEAGAAFVSLVVAAATAGTGITASMATAMAQSLGFAAEGAIQVALQAGLNTLAKQATISLINTQGDIGATLESLGSSGSLRALATSMVAAGLTVHLSSMAGLGPDLPVTASLTDRVVQDVQRSLIRATVNAGVSTAIQGGKLNSALISALRQEAALVIGENVAQQIGVAVDDGKLNTASQLIAHSALGCATGAVAGGDCASGAAGAVIGETVGLINKGRIAGWLEERVIDVRNGEVTPAQLMQEMNEMQAAGVDVARLASGLAVAVAGGDVDIAADAGVNAAENNALCGGICIGLIAAAVAAYTTWQGDGDPLKGLEVIGAGDDPLSRALESGTTAAVEWSASHYPEQTLAVLSVLEQTGDAIDAVVTFADEATGKTVSKHWNELSPSTRNRLKGAGKITSILIPGGSVKAFKQLETARANAKGTPNGRTGRGEADPNTSSGYPTLARPLWTTPTSTIFGELDHLGRPTGVTATINRNSIGTGSSANPSIRPPGFEGGANHHSRGHLLAKVLGGTGSDPRNLVTLFQRYANSPTMRSFEMKVRNAVNSGQTVRVRSIPVYSGNNPVPTGVTMTARGSGGFDLDVSVLNINGPTQ